jgi:hypothetical protein
VSPVAQDRGFRVFAADPVFQDFLLWTGVSGNDVAVYIENWTNEQNGIVERLASGNVLKIHAWTGVFATSGADLVSSNIEGTFSYCNASSKRSAVCESKNHRLTLTPR